MLESFIDLDEKTNKSIKNKYSVTKHGIPQKEDLFIYVRTTAPIS